MKKRSRAEKKATQSLTEELAKLDRASRLKSAFLVSMSHELRSPLNAILGFSEVFNDGLLGELTEAQQEYMGYIFNSGEQLLRITNDIIDLSKIEAGLMRLELESVDLTAILTECVAILRRSAAERQITLTIDAEEDLGLFDLDRLRAKQIILRLLSNALQFSSPGQKITVSARRVPRFVVGHMPGNWPTHAFPLVGHGADHFLEMSVEHTGTGFSVATMQKLFDEFSEIDTEVARKIEGAGLRLALVKQLAELFHGTVAVSSKHGQGARFAVWIPIPTTLEVPVVPAELGGSVPFVAAEQRQGGARAVPRTALVIEDDAPSSDLVRLLLQAEGFTVIVASSGEQALLLASKQPLSLITLDIGLPGMDGWTCLKRLRDDRRLAAVPVVVIAGLADSRLGMTSDVAALLEKPLGRTELKTTLNLLGLQPEKVVLTTILIVDDDPIAVELIARHLPASEFAVVRASEASEALALAQRTMPQLILLDLMTPDLAGVDLIQDLQWNPATASIPILVITGRSLTAQEKSLLPSPGARVIRVIEKTDLTPAVFMTEVRAALSVRELSPHRAGS